MAFSLGPLTIGNEVGLFALLALIPFLLLYLIKPKPRYLNVPSLMFFHKNSGVFAKLKSLFKNIIHDWLFIVQLIALLGLIFSLFSPFVLYDHDITAKNTVIVLDVSASSQVEHEGETRLEFAKRKAVDLLGSSNTIILAKQTPLIGLQEASSGQARRYINTVHSRDTMTKLGDAIILAGETLTEGEGRVIVLSDFINTEGQTPETAKKVLESKGLTVDFITTTRGLKKNVGIIELTVDDDRTIAYIKNFDTTTRNVQVGVGDKGKTITIGAGKIEPFAFETPRGITTLELLHEDDFIVDNKAIISGPPETRAQVVLVTNNKSVYLENALQATPFVDVSVSKPPIIPLDDFDIMVFHQLYLNEILDGSFEELLPVIEEGKTLIVIGQEDLESFDFKGLLPFTIAGNGEQGKIIVDQNTKFTKNIDFGVVNSVLNISSETAATIASVNNVPIIALDTVGNGKIFYIGLLEEASDFHLSPSYPIFWNEVLKFLTNKEDVSQLNFKTGKALLFDKKTSITTPKGEERVTTLILDEAGAYHTEGKTIAVNLLSEKESNINPTEASGSSATEYELKPVTEKRDYELETVLVIVTLIFLILELFVIKARGEI